MATVLSQLTLLDGTGAAPVRDACIVIDDGLIRSVTSGPVPPPAPGEEHHRLGGATVLPGLVDAHVHLLFSAGTDPRADVLAASDESLRALALANAQRGLVAGVTSMRDCGSRGMIVQRLRDEVNAGRLIGPTILAAGAPICAPGGHLWFMRGSLATAAGPVELVRARAAEGVDLIKVMASGGNLTPGSDPRQPELSTGELAEITRTAHDLGLRVAAHAHATAAIISCVAAGVDTIEHCSWLGPDGAEDYRPDVVDELVAKDIVVSPAVTAHFRDPARLADRPELAALVASRLRTTALMRERGVRMVIGTDAGCPHLAFGGHADTLPVYTQGFGFSPMQALLAATSHAARALGLADRLGSVVAGQQADLVVLRGDPLTDPSVLARPHRVYRAGRLVAQDGMLVG